MNKKNFLLKYIEALVSTHQNNTLLHRFSWTVIWMRIKWLNKKNFLLKFIRALVSAHQNNWLLHPFSWTVMVSITFSYKNIKCWKFNFKNIRLGLKTLINNNFLLNCLSNNSINKTKQWTATPKFGNCDGFY